eukprot:COSAG04_NODE_22199_length_359_cov_0.669231_1_plen_29_part_01
MPPLGDSPSCRPPIRGGATRGGRRGLPEP